MLATVSETLIFFFLGVVTITSEHEWNWAFILFTLLFAFLWRGLGILVLTQIINPFRTIQFSLKDQFGLAYGGLRGAICFALVFTLGDNINRRNLFVTASIAIIIFTVFIQGISIRPIVEYIKIRRTNKDLNTINVEIHTRAMEHLICGIEDLCGQFKKFNDRILRRILLRDNQAESSIVSLYKKLELQNVIELLDTPMGDISAAPSIVSLHDEKKEASRPKKKFGDTTAFSKYSLPDDSRAREILIRRHSSIRRSLRSESFREQPVQNISRSLRYYSLQHGGNVDSAFALRRQSHAIPEEDHLQSSGMSPRSSPRSLVPVRRLNTIEEQGSLGEPPAAFVHPLEKTAWVRGFQARASEDVKQQLLHPTRRSSNRVVEEDDVVSENQAGSEEQRPPPRGWVPENRDPGANEAENPFLRQSPQRSQHSWRT
ncbi:hypothetical protein CRENBAI_000357 [Crenichthys baileyi]|uniref:Sodium/hydrogen exchanger n=1 Tax=Crenichthys baileyi TaxID=28760 RepID=A0AAV9SP16_9TELE